MKISESDTDEAILEALGERIAQYRLNLNMSQAALAREAGISKRTLERLEAGRSTQLENFVRVLRALDLGGNLDALVPEPGISPIERLKLRGKARERASPRGEVSVEDEAGWTWDDS